MKEYDENKYILVNKKAAKFHKWVSYFIGRISAVIVALCVLLILLWSVFQVLLMLKSLV